MAFRAFLLFLAGAEAARTKGRAVLHRGLTETQLPAKPKRFAERFCISEDLNMTCDETSVIKVYSAFYNHRSYSKCPAAEPSAAESCAVNFTEKVLHCDGEHECIYPASEHSHCAKKPFKGVRAVWSCIPGTNKRTLEKEEVKEEIAEEQTTNLHAAQQDAPSPKESVPAVDEDNNIRYAKDFCLSRWLHFACEDGWRIEPVSAVYESRSTMTCFPETDVDCSERECSCETNATQMVYDRCAGGRYGKECTVPPVQHRHCQAKPFTFLRVLWDCVKGDERKRDSLAGDVA